MSDAFPNVEVEVDALAYGGRFIGRVVAGPETLLGKKALVSAAVPGERVRARITRDRGRLIDADTIEILRPSAERVTAPCPYFGTCGGCDLQHFSIEAQR